MKHLLVVALAACTPSSATTPAPGLPKPRAPSPALAVETGLLPRVQVIGEEAPATLAARMREYKIPAISIAVFDHYEIVWAKAYGLADVDAQLPATTDTTFLAGSISKSVNALAQLQAVADRRYTSLDTPINDALESWHLPDNELTRVKPVTLRMLLSHTGGTTVHGFRGYAPTEPVPTIQQTLEGTPPANNPAIRVDLAPGTKFRYSGGGTTITQLALTERTKQPYPEILAAEVLAPLGMTHSSYDQVLTPARRQHAAAGYDGDGKLVDGARFIYPEMAAAGLWTTPSDLARFFLEITKARAGTSTVVSQQLATQMTTRVVDIEHSADGIGLGVFLLDRNHTPYFGHGGADTGFQADALASLEGGRGIVIMANSENGFRVFPEIERTIFAALEWPGRDVRIVRVALTPAKRARFVGRFSVDDVPFEIVERAGKLMSRTPFGEAAELVPTATDVLVKTDDAARIKLTANGLEVYRDNRPPALINKGLGDHPLFLLEDGHVDEAVAALKTARKPKAEEDLVNGLGYQLLGHDPKHAIAVLQLNAKAFPDSANAHDSLAEAYGRVGDQATARLEYQRVLEVLEADPRMPDPDKPAFKKHVEVELAKLR